MFAKEHTFFDNLLHCIHTHWGLHHYLPNQLYFFYDRMKHLLVTEMEKLHHSSLVLNHFLEIASLSGQKIFQGFEAANYIHLVTWFLGSWAVR